jgi:hypothetical protein
MKSVARPPRHSTVRVTGPDGTTWQGDGDGLALAMRNLGRRHREGRPVDGASGERSDTRWTLTAKGWAAVAQERRQAAGGRP